MEDDSGHHLWAFPCTQTHIHEYKHTRVCPYISHVCMHIQTLSLKWGEAEDNNFHWINSPSLTKVLITDLLPWTHSNPDILTLSLEYSPWAPVAWGSCAEQDTRNDALNRHICLRRPPSLLLRTHQNKLLLPRLEVALELTWSHPPAVFPEAVTDIGHHDTSQQWRHSSPSQVSLSDFLPRCVNSTFSHLGLGDKCLESLTIHQKYIESTPMPRALLLAWNVQNPLLRVMSRRPRQDGSGSACTGLWAAHGYNMSPHPHPHLISQSSGWPHVSGLDSFFLQNTD